MRLSKCCSMVFHSQPQTRILETRLPEVKKFKSLQRLARKRTKSCDRLSDASRSPSKKARWRGVQMNYCFAVLVIEPMALGKRSH